MTYMKGENEAMIHLEVEEYCHECPDFEAYSKNEFVYSFDRRIVTDITVRCMNHKRCEVIFRHLEKKKNENSEDKEGPDT